MASLIVGAYHTAGQQQRVDDKPFPFVKQSNGMTTTNPDKLLDELETRVKAKDQLGVCAVVDRYGKLRHAPKPMFDLLLKFAISEDGALHAEKYYHTVREEFAMTRPAFRIKVAQ